VGTRNGFKKLRGHVAAEKAALQGMVADKDDYRSCCTTIVLNYKKHSSTP